MLPLIPIALAGGALIYVEAHPGPGATPPDDLYGPNSGTGIQGGQVSTTVGTSVTNGNTIVVGGVNGQGYAKRGIGTIVTGLQYTPIDQNLSPNPANQNTGDDATLNGKLDQISGYAQAAYDNLDDGAKAAAADALNKQLKLDPPLKGDESWEDLSGVVGGALGGAAGAYLGGPVGAKLGAILGAYLGVKLEDLISKNWDDLTAWLDNQWGAVRDQVTSWYNQAADGVGSAASSAWDDATSWI